MRRSNFENPDDLALVASILFAPEDGLPAFVGATLSHAGASMPSVGCSASCAACMAAPT